MPSRLTVEYGRLGATQVVALTGTLGVATMPALMAALDDAAAPGQALAVDLCELRVADAAALAVLIHTLRRLRRRGRVLVACPQGALRSAVEQTGLARQVDVVPQLS